MVCSQCGNNMESQERYCSKCGTDSFSNRVGHAPQTAGTRWDIHVKVLAWIFIIGALIIAVPGTIAFVFFGAFHRVMPHPMIFWGPIWLLMIPVFLALPAGIAVAGIGLLKYREWARILTLILSAFMLIALPFGTALGIYAFWVLLVSEGRDAYKSHVPSSPAA
jgi:hypothetical protein